MKKLHGSPRFVDLLGAAAAFATASAFSTPALADGGIPRGNSILIEPGNPDHILVRSIFWGLFDERNGPNSFKLLCSQAYGGRALQPEDLPTVLARGGRILVAGGFAGLISSDDSCDWKHIDAFNGEAVQSIAPADAAGTSFALATVLGEDGKVTSRVYTSTDRGDTWTKVKGAIQPDVSISGIAVAPSDPMRIYAVGVTINGGPRAIGVSKDGGATFNMLPIGAVADYDPTESKPLSVVGIAPTNPDTLFVRANGADLSGGLKIADELWVSSDAGKTWQKSFRPQDESDLPGFAFTPDGKNVLISGPLEGIKQASLADAVAGKDGAFTQIFSGAVWGLTFNDGKLYAGTDDFVMKPPSMLGMSTDQGKTFSPLVNHCNVGFPQCSPNSTMEMGCREQWERVGGYVTDYVNTCAGTAGAAGAAGASGTGGSGGAAGAATGGASGLPTSVGGSAGTTAPDNNAGGVGGSTRAGAKSSGCSVEGAPKRGPAPITLMFFAAMTLATARLRRIISTGRNDQARSRAAVPSGATRKPLRALGA